MQANATGYVLTVSGYLFNRGYVLCLLNLSVYVRYIKGKIMGTNYYIKTGEKIECSGECGHLVDEELHLGKSSVGWVFALHVIRDRDLNSLDDWMDLIENNPIHNEYGESMTAKEMLCVIRDRVGRGFDEPVAFYKSWPEFHRSNHSKEGPNGLLSRIVDGNHCIANGPGTWDLCGGEFS